jgi:DNA-binding transcriptional ArsR family regulator
VRASTDKPPQRAKRVEESVQYAVGHETRVKVLIALNEGIYTAAQLSKIVGTPPNVLANHLRKMLEDGSIEIAKEEMKRNFVTYWYKAVELSCYSQEEAEAMTPFQQQVTVGAIVQSATAELFAALYAGKLRDPRSVLFWHWYNVDEQGQRELEDESARYLARLREIEAESTNRRADSGENSTSMLVSLAVFERARKAPEFPAS